LTSCHDVLQFDSFSTEVRDSCQSINVNSSGSVDLGNFDPRAMGVDVMIDNPSGTNLNGAVVTDNPSLNLSSAKLRITNAGQPWGGDTGAVLIATALPSLQVLI